MRGRNILGEAGDRGSPHCRQNLSVASTAWPQFEQVVIFDGNPKPMQKLPHFGSFQRRSAYVTPPFPWASNAVPTNTLSRPHRALLEVAPLEVHVMVGVIVAIIGYNDLAAGILPARKVGDVPYYII